MKAPDFVRSVLEYQGYPLVADDLEREVFVTPYPAAHSGPGGYVVTIGGTPPRAVVLVIGDDCWIDLPQALIAFVFPGVRHRVQWLNPFNGSPRQQQMRSEIIKLLRAVGR
jgi:hypothetical protein